MKVGKSPQTKDFIKLLIAKQHSSRLVSKSRRNLFKLSVEGQSSVLNLNEPTSPGRSAVVPTVDRVFSVRKKNILNSDLEFLSPVSGFEKAMSLHELEPKTAMVNSPHSGLNQFMERSRERMKRMEEAKSSFV